MQEDFPIALPPSGRVRKTDVWRSQWWGRGWIERWTGGAGEVLWLLGSLLHLRPNRYANQASWDFETLTIDDRRWRWHDIDELGVVEPGSTIRIVEDGQVFLFEGPRDEERRATLMAHWEMHLRGQDTLTLPVEPMKWTDRLEGRRAIITVSRGATPSWLGLGARLLVLWFVAFAMLHAALMVSHSVSPAAMLAQVVVQGLIMVAVVLPLLVLVRGLYQWRQRGQIDVDLHRIEIREPTGDTWSATWDEITAIDYDDCTITITTQDGVVIWNADRNEPLEVRGLARELLERWQRGAAHRSSTALSDAERRRLGVLQSSRD